MDVQYYLDCLCGDVPWCNWNVEYINNIPSFYADCVDIEISFGHGQSPSGGMYPIEDLVLVYFIDEDDTCEFNGNAAFCDAVELVSEVVKQKKFSQAIVSEMVDKLGLVIK